MIKSFYFLLLCSIFTLFLFGSINAHGKILVIEFGTPSDPVSQEHGSLVAWVACQNQPMNCPVLFSESFVYSPFYSPQSFQYYQSFNRWIDDVRVVNASFGQQPPDSLSMFFLERAAFEKSDEMDERIRKNEKAKEEYKESVLSWSQVMGQFHQKLFVVTAGNGFRLIGSLFTEGSGFSPGKEIYPAMTEAPNKLTIAAFDTKRQRVYEYSNADITHVHVAAPVGLDPEGNEPEGTSFAAPNVSQWADEIFTLYPDLTPIEMVEIFMKSCVVPDVSKAIAASRDILNRGEDSLYHQAMHHRKKSTREALLRHFSDVVFVKSGGVLDPDLARECAKNYKDAPAGQKPSIQKACLVSHKKWGKIPVHQLEKLPTLWKVRGI